MAVPGEGPVDAKVMVIGEAPGREEDLSGRPFVGRGGKLLDSVLAKTANPRGSMFITNIVKCRPPKNRLPKRNERETCMKNYLIRQTDLVGPELTVLLGRTAAQSILGEDSLSSVRGKVLTKDGRRYFATYHPAAILRNPALKGTFEKDLKKAMKLVGRRQ
jgi:uracil-DNA glycosylase